MEFPFDNLGACQHFVKYAVIVAAKIDDLFPPGDSAGNANGRHDCFGAGVAEAHPLYAGHLPDHGGDFARQPGMGADFDPFFQFGVHRFGHKVGGVAEEVDAKTEGHVYVFVAVNVPQM